MDASKTPLVNTPRGVIGSSPEILSPGGKSRYGRTRRPKITQDFYDIDSVIIDETPPIRQPPSPMKSPKMKSPMKIERDILFEIKDEFTKLDDLGMKVANNFKTNLQRGLDDTIKERKFFKSMPESKVEMPNVVDVTKVLKLISTKPAVITDVYEKKPPPKSTLKTYSNKRKHVHDSESFIVESFGLPDEPIIPVNSPLAIQRDTQIDIDVNIHHEVNLDNPWIFDEFQSGPMFVSDPVTTMEEFTETSFGKNSSLDLFCYDSLLSESTEHDSTFDTTPVCLEEPVVQLETIEFSIGGENFQQVEKSENTVNISTNEQETIDTTKTSIVKKYVKPVDIKPDNKTPKANEICGDCPTKNIKNNASKKTTLANCGKDANLSIKTSTKETTKNDSIKCDIIDSDPKIENKSETQLDKNDAKVVKESPVIVKKRSKLQHSPQKENKKSRILRSNVETNVNTDVVKEVVSEDVNIVHRSLRSDQNNKTVEVETPVKSPIKVRKTKAVVNPVKLSKVCKSQVRVILNPLASMKQLPKKFIDEKTLVPNPFKIKRRNYSKLSLKQKKKLRSFKQNVSDSIVTVKKNKLKRNINKEVEVKQEDLDIDIKNIKTELIDYNVGDLTWAKIGTHPYWPCLITQEPISGDHKKIIVHRATPLYHVRFFGDKGRRSWVSSNRIMLYCGRDDLEKMARALKTEGKIKSSFIKECYTIRPAKLEKWQSGVDEAEALKLKTVNERLNYFFELFASKREKRLRLRELGIKEEDIDEILEAESKMDDNKQNLIEHEIKEEILDAVLETEEAKASKKRVRVTIGDSQEQVVVKKAKKSGEEDREVVVTKKSGGEDEKKSSDGRKSKAGNTSPERRKKIKKSVGGENLKKSRKSDLRVEKKLAASPKKGGRKEETEISPSKKLVQKQLTDEISPSKKLARKSNQVDSEEAQSPKKVTKKMRLNEDSLPPPETPKKTAKKSQTNENRVSETPKKIQRKSQSKKEIVEGNQSTETRKKVVKKPEESLEEDNSQNEEMEESPPNARKKLRNFQPKGESEEAKKKTKADVPKEETVEETVEFAKKPKRISTEESLQEVEESEENSAAPKLRKRQLIPCESDTDSKFSDNSSVPTSLESQAALYRRNNIFRGIPREKVCQICENPGEVFKCKGPCNGVYHYNCAMSIEIKEICEEEKKPEAEKQETDVGDKNNVEIIAVNSKKPLPNLSTSPNFKGMSLAEKIDFRMKEIMKKFDYQSVYSESTDSSSEEFIMDESFEKADGSPNKIKNQTKLSLTITSKPSKKEVPIIKHVTADNINYICVTNERPKDKEVTELIKDTLKHLRCTWCSSEEIAKCLVCNKEESKLGSKFRQKCSLHQCGKYYHPECLKVWPQTQWSLIHSTKDKKSDASYDTFVCPRHVCHTCISDDPRAANSRCPSDKVVKCLRCPATYHSSNYCVPAGTHILSSSQIICPRHFSNQKSTKKRNFQQTINTNWCFICSKGGNLICCETCPTSVHVECMPGDPNEDDTFFCEDCQSGRLPLYDEIVWVKLGSFRWWPALILFPNEVPDNVRHIAHNKGEFVVKFFGTYDHYWVGRGRTFLFQEGDKGHSNPIRKRVDNAFVKAIEEAAAAHNLKKQFKVSKVAQKNTGLKPPPYIRIKVNKPVGNVRQFDGNTSNTTSCECDPNQPHPCGPDSDCLNRLLLTECNPDVCPAGERCNNQCFEKREYPPLVPHRTQVRGWGLKTLAPIRKGQFVIEYVGEMIDEQEYQRRIQKMHEQKEENYYFLTIDKDRMLDAGPKGNVARFMNHSCQPNCETQKWTVNGDTRVGLFAKCDIPADTELTFNYNLECIGKEKKICKCGAPNCSGFIGVKVKSDGPQKKSNKPRKKKSPPPPDVAVKESPCFVCGKVGDVGACNNKICAKYYHLVCVGMVSWPEGGKWVCQWHTCNICSKRTIRCCVKCLNSYCPPHSEGNVRYDKLLGFVCTDHDPTKESNEVVISELPKSSTNVSTEEGAVTSTTSEETTVTQTKKAEEAEDEDFLDSLNLSVRLNGWVTSTPLKKNTSTGESTQEENTVSSVSSSETKSKTKKSKKKKKKITKKKVTVSKVQVKNAANLFNTTQNEVKLSNFTPMKYLRTSRHSSKVSDDRTDPDKDLPIRKRTRLRCGNTL